MGGLFSFLLVGWFVLGFFSGFCLLRVNWRGLGLCCLFGGGSFVQSCSFVYLGFLFFHVQQIF